MQQFMTLDGKPILRYDINRVILYEKRYKTQLQTFTKCNFNSNWFNAIHCKWTMDIGDMSKTLRPWCHKSVITRHNRMQWFILSRLVFYHTKNHKLYSTEKTLCGLFHLRAACCLSLNPNFGSDKIHIPYQRV